MPEDSLLDISPLEARYVPISALVRIRVARMVGEIVVEEVVSQEVAIYHPYNQLPSLVDRVMVQLEERR